MTENVQRELTKFTFRTKCLLPGQNLPNIPVQSVPTFICYFLILFFQSFRSAFPLSKFSVHKFLKNDRVSTSVSNPGGNVW